MSTITSKWPLEARYSLRSRIDWSTAGRLRSIVSDANGFGSEGIRPGSQSRTPTMRTTATATAISPPQGNWALGRRGGTGSLVRLVRSRSGAKTPIAGFLLLPGAISRDLPALEAEVDAAVMAAGARTYGGGIEGHYVPAGGRPVSAELV